MLPQIPEPVGRAAVQEATAPPGALAVRAATAEAVSSDLFGKEKAGATMYIKKVFCPTCGAAWESRVPIATHDLTIFAMRCRKHAADVHVVTYNNEDHARPILNKSMPLSEAVAKGYRSLPLEEIAKIPGAY
jgi:hypothetical protein